MNGAVRGLPAASLGLALAALAVACPGCVLYRDAVPPAAAVTTPTCVSVKATYKHQVQGGLAGDQSDAERLVAAAQKAAAASGLVSGSLGADAKQLEIEVVADDHPNLILSMLCGFTLTIVPGYWESEITVRAKVVDHGQVVRDVSSRATAKMVIEFFLIFVTPAQDFSWIEHTVMELTAKACSDLAR